MSPAAYSTLATIVGAFPTAILTLGLAACLTLAIAEVRAAWRQTSRANLDAVLRQDPARVEQMAAIAEAEEAWDRDVWGGR